MLCFITVVEVVIVLNRCVEGTFICQPLLSFVVYFRKGTFIDIFKAKTSVRTECRTSTDSHPKSFLFKLNQYESR